MIKVKSILVFLLAISLTLGGISTVAHAEVRYVLFPNGGQMASAPYSKYYYKDGSIGGYNYHADVNAAMTDWSNTPNTYIWMFSTADKSKSIIDFHAVPLPDSQVGGQTTVWNNNVQLNFYGGYPWYWAKVEINTDLDWTIYEPVVSPDNLLKNVVAHEAGHAFGLDHSPYMDTLMYRNALSAFYYNIFGPTSAEVEGVRALFGTRY